MNNRNVVLIGMTGAGKTVYAKNMLAVTPRAVVLDIQGEYEDGEVFYDWRESVDFWRAHMAEDWHIIFRGEDRSEHLAWIDILTQAQNDRDLGLPPIGLFVEESSYYSDTHVIPSVLDRVYTKGRHGRISVVTVVQRLTQIHPIIRDMSPVWISFRVRSAPGVLREKFPSEDLERLPYLETLIPNVRPEYGKHFLTDTGEVDPLAGWIGATY